MKGYLKNQQANEETFDGEWLKTGDLGKISQNGLLTISDRLKELIKVTFIQANINHLLILLQITI